MLELRPNCECCDKDLPPHSTEAFICSYECTFCADCVAQPLNNVCPNCGGGFAPRPIRPQIAHREGICIKYQKPSTKRVYTPYKRYEITSFTKTLKDLKPEQR